MNSLYPLKFEPIFKDYIWGGINLREKLNKVFPKDINRCAESWEISSVQDNISVVSNGFLAGNNLQEIIEIYMGDLVGDKVYKQYGDEFPLLIKLIDATDDLSIQVHPDDETAKKKHHAFGKTEMWYVINSEPNSQIITGFKSAITKDEFKNHLKDNSLKNILNNEKAAIGDVFFIPPGRVHAIGKGILLAEIQQTSDITYRIFDWGRVDKAGKPRELHTELALDILDFRKYNNYKSTIPTTLNKTSELVSCSYFTVNRLSFNKSIGREYHLLDSFVIYLCIEGSANVLYGSGISERIVAGETILIPSDLKELILKPTNFATILEIFIK
ncbi:MAG: type I phosphomannose isomerase catalytic subunit [Tenuifilaceae bacterium]